MGTQTPTRPKKNKKQRPDAATARRLTIIKARNKRISLIAVGLCLCVVILAGIITGVHFLLQQVPEKDDKILPNVYVGGVNIGELTLEDAKNVVQLSLLPILMQEDMVVTLPNDTLRLAPADTGLTLDVDALVDHAFSYGRSGSKVEQRILRAQAKNRAYHIALLPYMTVDLHYVRKAVEDFCEAYQTELIQPTVALQGERPDREGFGDTPVVHQTLTITMGSPESALSPDAIYEKILDGYSLMQLQQEYEAPIAVEPERPDAQALFDQFCQLPQDATIDNNTFDITPEVYGYGFNVENLQRQIDRAEYGQVIQVTLDFLLPDITVNALNTNLFKDTLASYVSRCTDGTNTNRDKNLQLSCAAINGYILKVGESFDFDDILGPRTKNKGYREAPTYSGSTTTVVGGGINQTASALYYCALQAGLTINERHAHRYAVTYTPLGTDASISYGSESLVFTNNTSAPIRILASVEGSTVSITFLGTETRDHSVQIQTVVKETFAPTTVYQYMDPENVFGYVDGQVTQTSQTGYAIEVYICKYDRKTGALIERILLTEARYDARDRIVIKMIGKEEDIV